MQAHIVDVFAENPLEGNQLAVILDAGNLSTATMQRIALEMNYSETTFVTQRQTNRAKVRIFTPTAELPFAGHPTLGTAWVLGKDQADFTLELGIGDVTVTFDQKTGLAWMTAPEPTFSPGISPELATTLLALPPNKVDGRWPILQASLGPTFQMIGLQSQAALSQCNINSQAFAQFAATCSGVASLFVFAPSDNGPSKYAARMFFDVGGPREDPATGSANCCFAAYLRDQTGQAIDLSVDQGIEMGRPSRIYLHTGLSAANPLEVGGKVQSVLKGELTL